MKRDDGTVGREGHSMTVQGYATIQKNSSGARGETVMVADGWFEAVSYISLGYNWTNLAVTEFYLR